MGVGSGLGNGVYWRGRNIMRGEMRQRFLHGHATNQLVQSRFNDVAMLTAFMATAKARVVLPRGLAQGVAHAGPMVLVTSSDEDPAISTGIHPAHAVPLGLTARTVVGADGNLRVAIARV